MTFEHFGLSDQTPVLRSSSRLKPVVTQEVKRGVGDGQGDLACCNSWVRKEMDTTERLN